MPARRIKLTCTEKLEIGARQKWKCACCGKMLDAYYEPHHVIELSKGGRDHPDNMVALLPSCHRKITYDGLYRPNRDKPATPPPEPVEPPQAKQGAQCVSKHKTSIDEFAKQFEHMGLGKQKKSVT